MTQEQIIRAWKDEAFRRSLSGEELSALPQHPAGLIELPESALVKVGGQEEAATLLCAFTIPAICGPVIIASSIVYVTLKFDCF